MENLTKKELTEISGGALQSGNPAGFGILLSAGTDNLLSLTFNNAYEDHQGSTTLSIGKDIDLGLGWLGSKQ
ncbi:hypothetical protein OC25_16705 [Pedobacter kyungheensis]|uniref:Bacteriocin n=1 Tax=Pedobacter kyungheensis TaxID=1069985 RepID=A0A0C1D5L9_9SPHI|nr:bacteriocin [Pedobacter kyungheensis]KIA92326.1 hypothetical protein OC25_16705 [Pedobacter kyungheensis]